MALVMGGMDAFVDKDLDPMFKPTLQVDAVAEAHADGFHGGQAEALCESMNPAWTRHGNCFYDQDSDLIGSVHTDLLCQG
jgi:hypothetical protein